MATQTITLTTDADDGYEGSGGTWNVSGASGFDYVAGNVGGPNRSAFSFTLSQPIKGDALITKAFLRLNSTTDQSGSISIDLQVENANPKTNTIPSGSHLPSAMTAVRSHVIASTAYGSNVFYFGEADTNATNLAQDFQDLLRSFGDMPIGARFTIFLEEVGDNGNYASFDDSSLGANDPQLTIEWQDPSNAGDVDDPRTKESGDSDFTCELSLTAWF